jgi:hypothetical protein
MCINEDMKNRIMLSDKIATYTVSTHKPRVPFVKVHRFIGCIVKVAFLLCYQRLESRHNIFFCCFNGLNYLNLMLKNIKTAGKRLSFACCDARVGSLRRTLWLVLLGQPQPAQINCCDFQKTVVKSKTTLVGVERHAV